MQRAGAVRPLLDRGADQPRRHPRPRRDRAGASAAGSASPPASTATTGSIFKQLLQARRDRLLPDRRLPARRRQRDPRRPAAGGQVRRPGLPARRRRRPVRVRAASVDVRLHRASAARWRTGSSSTSTTCTSTSSTRCVIRDGRYLVPDGAGLQHHHEAGLAGTLRLPGRARVGAAHRRARSRARGRGGRGEHGVSGDSRTCLPRHRRRKRDRSRDVRSLSPRRERASRWRTSTRTAAHETVQLAMAAVGGADVAPGGPPRRHRSGVVRGGRRQRSSAPRGASTSCSTTPGSRASAPWRRRRWSSGNGSWPSTCAASSWSPRPSCRSWSRRVVGRSSTCRRRSPRSAWPTGVVRRLQGSGPGAHPADAGGLCEGRDPRQCPAAGNDPHAVRGPLPRRELRRSGRRPGSLRRPAADRRPRTDPRTSRRRPCSWPPTSRGSSSGRVCSWTVGFEARNELRAGAMRLLSHLTDGEERLAVALDDRDALDVADLLGDGPVDDGPAPAGRARPTSNASGSASRRRRSGAPAGRPPAGIAPAAATRPAGQDHRHRPELPRARRRGVGGHSRRAAHVREVSERRSSGDGAAITWSAGLTGAGRLRGRARRRDRASRA